MRRSTREAAKSQAGAIVYELAGEGPVSMATLARVVSKKLGPDVAQTCDVFHSPLLYLGEEVGHYVDVRITAAGNMIQYMCSGCGLDPESCESRLLKATI